MKALQSTLVHEFRQHFSLFALASFCLALLLVRAKLTQSINLFFLIWNLFLAYAPLGLSSLMMHRVSIIEKWHFYPAFACWLLLLPNAPYIITDFVHLEKQNNIPLWFDILLIASFTTCGMLFGLASMKNVYTILSVKFSSAIATTAMAVTCLLSGFGIYLGRFLRYNSWDVLHKPLILITDIVHSLVAFDTYRAAWGITIGFGTLLFLLFRLYYDPKE